MKSKEIVSIALITLIMAVLLLSACSNEEGSPAQEVPTVDEVEDVDAGAEVSLTVKNEMLDYAKYNADLSCQIIEAGLNEDPNAIMETMANSITLAEEYGFTEEDLATLAETYTEDEDYAKAVLSEVESLCPEYLEQIAAENAN